MHFSAGLYKIFHLKDLYIPQEKIIVEFINTTPFKCLRLNLERGIFDLNCIKHTMSTIAFAFS